MDPASFVAPSHVPPEGAAAAGAEAAIAR